MKIRFVFVMYTLLVVGVIFLGFGTAFLTSEKRYEQRSIQNKKEQSILQLSKICERAFYENGLILEGFRKGLKEEVGFYSAACLDTEGNDLDFTRKPTLRSIPKQTGDIDPNLFFRDTTVLPSGNAGEEIVAPLLFGGQRAGFAKIVFDQSGIERHLKRRTNKTLRQLFILSGFPLILALIGVIGFVKAMERLHDLNEKKKELINSVTHEFRSPLTAIQSFCGLLLKGVYGPLKANQHETVSIIQNNSLRLSQFVDDLLVMAAFESKEQRLFMEDIDIADLFKSLKKTYQPLAKEKKISLKVLEPKPSVFIKTDRSKLLQIMENLVSNAIKYTEKGFVEIGCEEEKDNFVVFVKDSGHGISAEDQKQIFDPFFRSVDHARSIKGTGLGLSIVKAYASQLKAAVHVQSEPGKGSCFSLTLRRQG